MTAAHREYNAPMEDAATEPRVLSAAMLVLILALVGISMIMLLMRSWRRYNQRLQAHERKSTDTDAWAAAGQRLQVDDTSLDEPPPDDEDEPPADAPDRRS